MTVPRQKRWASISLITASFGLMGTLVASPMVNQIKIVDERRAFANISHLQIQVNPLPHAMREEGMDEDALRRHVKRRMEAADIEITDDVNEPKLSFTTVAMDHNSCPGTVGYIVFVDLVQRTRIVRLEDELVLPTATIPVFAMKPKEELADAVRDSVDTALDRVLQAIRLTSAVPNDL